MAASAIYPSYKVFKREFVEFQSLLMFRATQLHEMIPQFRIIGFRPLLDFVLPVLIRYRVVKETDSSFQSAPLSKEKEVNTNVFRLGL